MDLSALRKLSMTLKPLIEITEVLEKVENAEQQLGSIKGRTVAAQREYDVMVAKTNQIKIEAEKTATALVEKAKEEAKATAARAKIEAEASTKLATEHATFRLTELQRKADTLELTNKDLEDRRKQLHTDVVSAEKRLKLAENSLAELRAAHAAVRI